MLPKEVFLFWKLCSRWKLQPLCVCPQKVLILQRNLVMVGLLTGIPCRGFSLNFHQGLETFRLAWGKMGRKLMQPLPRNSSFMRSLSCWELLSILLAPVYLTGPSSAFLSWGRGALAALRSSHPLGPSAISSTRGQWLFVGGTFCSWNSSGASRSCCCSWGSPTARASLYFISGNPLLCWKPKVPS